MAKRTQRSVLGVGLLVLSVAALASVASASARLQGICTGYAGQSQCDQPPAASSLSRALSLPQGMSVAFPDSRLLSTPLPACGPHVNGSSPSLSRRLLSIGDFGLEGNCAAWVALLSRRVEAQFGAADFVFTTGDNNYWDGSCGSLAGNVDQYYSRFYTAGTTCTDPSARSLGGIRDIATEALHQRVVREGGTPDGLRKLWPRAFSRPLFDFRRTASEPAGNRFFPSIGNHDWDTFKNFPSQLPYLQHFNYLSLLPSSDVGASGQYYTIRPVPEVQLFSINSNLASSTASSQEQALFAEQREWLQRSLLASDAMFKFVYFHHAPFCTAQHDPLAGWMDMPYSEWGATAVFSGHEHVYERIQTQDMLYIVNGLGGHPWRYEINNCVVQTGSRVRHNSHHGLLLGLLSSEADADAPTPRIDWCFYSVEAGGTLVDHFVTRAAPAPQAV